MLKNWEKVRDSEGEKKKGDQRLRWQTRERQANQNSKQTNIKEE